MEGDCILGSRLCRLGCDDARTRGYPHQRGRRHRGCCKPRGARMAHAQGLVAAIGITAAVAASYLVYRTIVTASSGRSVAGVLLFLPVPLWYLWAFRILSRSSRRVTAQ